MKIFRFVMKSVYVWEIKTYSLYVIQPSKDEAIAYVNRIKKEKYVIHKVYYLGYELSSAMFMGGKENAT